MKKITIKNKTLLFLFGAIGIAFNVEAQYCAASCTGPNYGLYVGTVVTTGGTTNINHTGGSGTNYYLDVAETLTIPAGGTFNLATTPGGAGAPGVRAVVYIDYNGDGDFEDAGELVGPMSPQKVWRDPAPTDNKNITVPASATIGITKMRILGGDAWVFNDDMTGNDPDGPGIPSSPCGDKNNSSWKDFDVVITNPYCLASCTGPNYGLYVGTVVTTGGTTNINHTGGSGTNYYLDVAETLTIPAGGTFNLATTPGGAGAPGVRAVVYIDYNGDGDFEDAGELVGPMSPQKVWRDPAPTDNKNITVPASATIGITKMRILGGDAWVFNDDMTGNDPDGPGIPSSPCGDKNNSSWKDFKVQIVASLGVENLAKNLQFSVYPNPIKGESINLSMNIQNEKVSVKLYNITGKLIKEINYKSFNNAEQIDLPFLTKGVYLLNVTTEKGSLTQKVVK